MSFEWIAYADTPQEIELLIDAGINHIILQDPTCSIRSTQTKGNDHSLDRLVKIARKKSPSITLSLLVDFMFHDNHEALVNSLIKACIKLNINNIRVQDFGLALYLKDNAPQLNRHLVSDFGNKNTLSIQTNQSLFSRQQLSNELPFNELETIVSKVPGHYDIQVHGPLLIQYSYRRYLDGLFNSEKEVYSTQAQDHSYPGRLFDFTDNRHGHLMYATFDRCLFAYINQLKALNLTGWIIDTRGYDLTSIPTIIKAYKKPESITLKELQKINKKPLKAGFFRANQTDRIRESSSAPQPENSIKVGEVVDIIHGKHIILDLNHPIKRGDSLVITPPKSAPIELNCDVLLDISGEDIQNTDHNHLALIRWHKGAQSKSQVYLRTH